MSVIKPTCIRDLKLRVNLADVVARVVTLKKAGGARLKGLCPFHNEKTPSFNVDTAKGFYKCFGCGKAGDLISFVRETEQLGFTEAVEALGQRFGIVIEYEQGAGPSREERSLRQELFDLHEQAADYFRETFKTTAPTGDYMRAYWCEQRQFPPELAEEFKIGAAEPSGDGLAARLWKRHYSEEALRQCGLFFLRDGAVVTAGGMKPRFRGRLMIPIRDHQERIVAFTARQTGLTPTDDPSREAKYVNSPETPIFTKGHLLFNLDRARKHVGEGHPFVMVEGQLDALRCWQVGLKTAVAPQGTAITDQQLVLLRRYHSQVECFFDSDSAGQKAALRFLPLALKAGLEVRFLGHQESAKIDPDLLFLEKGLAAYESLQRDSLSCMAFACRSLLPEPASATPEQKSRAARTVIDLIATAESDVARSEFLNESARHLHLAAAALQSDFRAAMAGNRIQPPVATTSPVARTADIAPEQQLLMLCLHSEQLGKPLSHLLPHNWIDTRHPAGALLNRFLAEFEHDAWPGKDHLDSLLETEEERLLVASLVFDLPVIQDPKKAISEGLRKLRARALEPRLREIELALANEGADSKIDQVSLLKERLEIHRQLCQPLSLPAAD